MGSLRPVVTSSAVEIYPFTEKCFNGQAKKVSLLIILLKLNKDSINLNERIQNFFLG